MNRLAPHKSLKHLFEMAGGRTARQLRSNVDTLRDAECVFGFDAQISDGAVDLGVAKQKLDCSQIARKLMPCPDCPDLFWKQRSFLTDDPPPVPGSAFRGCCGKLDSWHDMPSDPPSVPCHQHRADGKNIAYVGWPLSSYLNIALHGALAAIFVLPAHAAKKSNSPVGLNPSIPAQSNKKRRPIGTAHVFQRPKT
jgi:hypothetical protein